MSSLLSELSGASVGAVETAIGFALGFAASDALGPLATTIRQEVYSADPSRALDPGDAARIVAQALQSLGWGENEAGASGINSGKFDLLAQSELRAPAVGELLTLLRRSQLSEAEWTHGLRKAQLEPAYDDLLRGLTAQPLAPGEIGTAIHRGIMQGPDLLLVSPPSTPGRVEQVPPSTIDPVAQAAWWGLSHEQLRVLVGITGLPLPLGEMLQLLNRREVSEDDVKRAVAESNIRNEYMDVALNLRRRLLTPREYAEAELRGVLAHTDAAGGAGLSGLETGDYATLFATVGRPLNVHAITTGLARGGDFGGSYADVPEPYRDAIRRSATRPEYARLAYANRFNYPSAFVLRSLVQGGELTAEDGHKTLLDIGWEPTLARKVADAWGSGTVATGDKHEAKAEAQVWTALHKSYVSQLSTDAEAEADLHELGVAAEAIPKVLRLWQAERAIVRRSLTPAQLKKAVKDALMTVQEATARLLGLGYSAEDAATLLAE